jgi:flagellar biosynthesis/type III secretory pathway protein FliH
MGRLVKGAGAAVPVGATEDHRRGFDAGFAAGREAGLAEVTELLASARADAEEVRARARDAALTLGRRMAEKIVGHAVEVAPEVMGDIVSQALAAARVRAGNVTLRVHPEDLPAVEATRAAWGPRGAVVRLVPDGAVGRHGCVVETPAGRVDARLAAQLEALARAVRGRGAS